MDTNGANLCIELQVSGHTGVCGQVAVMLRRSQVILQRINESINKMINGVSNDSGSIINGRHKACAKLVALLT